MYKLKQIKMDLKILTQYENDGWLISQKHQTLPLTIWNYSQSTQFEGFWNDVTLAARGLVTDNKGNVVARPFKKFFNIEEGRFTPTTDYKVYEKMDGSLGILFYYMGEWIFATRGSFTSDQAIKGREILNKYNFKYLSGHVTYLFEIIYPENRIVVDYGDKEELIMLGAVNTKTGNEYDIYEEGYDNLGFKLVPQYSVADFKLLKDMVADDAEGFIVSFTNGDKIKIKGAEYCRLHKVMTNISTLSVWDCLRNGDSLEELLKDVPDEFYNKIKEYRDELVSNFNFVKTTIEHEFIAVNKKLGEVSDKEFALYVMTHKFRPFLFSLRKGREIDQAVWTMIRPDFMKL